MKTPSVFPVKLMLPLLLILGMGSQLSYGFGTTELQLEVTPTEENLKSARTIIWALRENSVPEFSDPSENNFFQSISGKPLNCLLVSRKSRNYYSYYNRDLRKYISSLTFPTHFFL